MHDEEDTNPGRPPLHTKAPQAPEWIRDALDAVYPRHLTYTKFASALIDRMPLARMIAAAAGAIHKARDIGSDTSGQLARVAVSSAVAVMAEPDHEVAEFTELYMDACRALADAGVPHVGEGDRMLSLGDRIRWLARQHPSIPVIRSTEGVDL